MIKLKPLLSELGNRQGEKVPSSSDENDAVAKYLKMMSEMPTHEPPPLTVWQLIVDNAATALRHYENQKKGLQEISFMPKGTEGSNEDSLEKFLSSLAELPDDEVPPLDVWKGVIVAAKLAQKVYQSKKKK